MKDKCELWERKDGGFLYKQGMTVEQMGLKRDGDSQPPTPSPGARKEDQHTRGRPSECEAQMS